MTESFQWILKDYLQYEGEAEWHLEAWTEMHSLKKISRLRERRWQRNEFYLLAPGTYLSAG